MRVTPERPDDDVIDHDMILVWSSQRRIITGSDLLGRLLRDISCVEEKPKPIAAIAGAAKAVAVTPPSEISHITVKNPL
jgi:hypothetical protein